MFKNLSAYSSAWLEHSSDTRKVASSTLAARTLIVIFSFYETNMKTAIIFIAIWIVTLELWVKTAERKSKLIREEHERKRMRRIREREDWIVYYKN